MRHYAQSEFRRPRPPAAWHLANRLLGVLIACVLLGVIAAAFYPEWSRRGEMSATLDSLKRQLADETATLKKREREVTLLKTDPEYNEILARDKLDMMKPGETIFRLEGSRASGHDNR